MITELKSNINIDELDETELAIKRILVINGQDAGSIGMIQSINSENKTARIIVDGHKTQNGYNISLRDIKLLPQTIKDFDKEIEQIENEVITLKEKKDFLENSESTIYDELRFQAHKITTKILTVKDQKEAENEVFKLIRPKD